MKSTVIFVHKLTQNPKPCNISLEDPKPEALMRITAYCMYHRWYMYSNV